MPRVPVKKNAAANPLNTMAPASAKNTTRNILAGYIMGDGAEDVVKEDDEAIFQFVMRRLDLVFDGQASKYYMKHKLINWSKEPFTRGTYAFSRQLVGVQNLKDLNQVFIAGEAFPCDSWMSQGWVHGAAFSGKSAAHKILLLDQPDKKLKKVVVSTDWGSYSYDRIVNKSEKDSSSN